MGTIFRMGSIDMVNGTIALQGLGTGRATAAAVVAVMAFVMTACGGGRDEAAATGDVTAQSEPAAQPPADAGAAGAATAQVKPADPPEPRLATAVPQSKTTAPIDLQYDLPAKPEAGRPFSIELVVQPRLPGDMLDVEIADSPGIVIEGERAARFLAVEAGQPCKLTVQARGSRDGLYFLSVMTKLSTKVQSEGRAFAVPVVIGTPVVAQKAAPPKDATGQPIESMPATEE